MIKNVLAGTAAALLVLAPIAAQAGTRASDAPVSLTPMSRLGSPVGTTQGTILHDGDGLLLILALIVAGISIPVVIESQNDDGTPATS